jgi:hypothetical protein
MERSSSLSPSLQLSESGFNEEQSIDPERIVAEARIALMRLEAVENANRKYAVFRQQGIMILSSFTLILAASILIYIRFFTHAYDTYVLIVAGTSATVLLSGILIYIQRAQHKKLLAEAEAIKHEIAKRLHDLEPRNID